MPSLIDALDSISAHSKQISQLSAHNTSPAGPFVLAYLYQPTVNGLIRDAHESETRLFKFVGQVDGAAGGVVKKVEKRDGELTPLKEYKRRKENREGNGRDEVEAMLRVAMKLVDDYRPMPRARAHIAKLLAEHQRQLERIDELEQLIADASGPSKPAAPARDLASTADQSSAAPMTAEDAIKAEEASLRALDASLADLRRNRPPSPEKEDVSPEKTPPASPPRRARPSVGAALQATPRTVSQTPASKTPRHNITNALVNGTTPARSRPTIDRFSPLRDIGTPRRLGGRESGLRNVLGEEDGGRRSIFGGKALHFSTASSSSRPMRQPLGEVQDENGANVEDASMEGGEEEEGEEERNEDFMDGEDDTVRFAPHQQAQEELVNEQDEDMEESSLDEDLNAVAGVDVESPEVKAATIWATLSDLMAYNPSKDHEPATQNPTSIVARLHAIAISDVPPPPSPSSASSLSALASLPSTGPRPAVITSQTILLAHLCVLLLRAFSDGGNGTLDLAQAKEMLNGTAKARGWDAEVDIGTKTVYTGVGKRVFKLDRRGGGSGRIGFAL